MHSQSATSTRVDGCVHGKPTPPRRSVASHISRSAPPGVLVAPIPTGLPLVGSLWSRTCSWRGDIDGWSLVGGKRSSWGELDCRQLVSRGHDWLSLLSWVDDGLRRTGESFASRGLLWSSCWLNSAMDLYGRARGRLQVQHRGRKRGSELEEGSSSPPSL